MVVTILLLIFIERYSAWKQKAKRARAWVEDMQAALGHKRTHSNSVSRQLYELEGRHQKLLHAICRNELRANLLPSGEYEIILCPHQFTETGATIQCDFCARSLPMYVEIGRGGALRVNPEVRKVSYQQTSGLPYYGKK
ncbi:MAG TPA: hypothetical protein VIG74_02395 [Alphaproteobacteria bacterium]